ncbi:MULTISPECIES: HNH endonuclease family protein [Micromonospora]|uniref:HNH endonuclease n=1 Tax=Micromonospora antibiotica TaxID=2807623 RepID=A0ABS3V5B5_9ACTN|nr:MULTISPECIES: HNH endonuclease family protein [Micromonospora]MBO4160773.1 HNH endonuclease [Micromonospora antibiotica]MBW4700642.1 HNH endonuclease [Micromonospora sp. RL09-050-HVF-A]
MNRRLRAAATIPTAVLAATLGLAHPAEAAGYSAPLTTAVAGLPVAAENRTGYSRDLFPHWIDADGDGCTTRNEVLLAEAVSAPTVTGTCTLTGGRWYSYYDDASWTATGDLDIDHMVPLAEAWDSGARTWSTSRRQAYANDLGDSRPLAAVTDNVNQSKGDQDPASWLPPYAAARCRYVTEWVATKIRWRLTVDSVERSALTSLAGGCPNATVSVTYAY